MKCSSIWALVKINILYANPQALASIRKKQANSSAQRTTPAYRIALRQQGLLLLLYSFIFTFLFSSGIHYDTHSGYFSFQLTTFFLISVVSGFSTMFSVFYNSHDTKLYLPLPVTEQEIYLAKLLSSASFNLTFLMPCLSLFLISYWQLTGQVLLAIPLALLQFLLLSATSILFSAFLLHLLGRLLMRVRRRNLIATGLMTASSIGALALIALLESQHKLLDKGADFPPLPFAIGFHQVVQHPFSLTSLLHYWLFLLAFLLLLAFFFKRIIPRYYEQLAVLDRPHLAAQQKSQKARTTRQVLRRHHFSTLADPTLLVTSQTMLLLTLMFFVGQVFAHVRFYAQIDLSYFGLVFLAGFLMAYLTLGSLTMVGISLERGNYLFLTSLPLDFTRFLRQKFWILWGIQSSIALLAFGVLTFFLRLPFPLILAFLLGLGLASYPVGLKNYKWDFRHLFLQWQTVNQLFNRGGGALLNMLLLLLYYILSIALLALAFFLTTLLGAWTISVLSVAICLLLVIGLHFYYEKTFWAHLH